MFLILVFVIGGIFLKKASLSFSEFMSDPKAGIVRLVSYPIKKAMLDALPEGVEAAEAEMVMEEFWAAIIEGRIDDSVGEKLGTKFKTAFDDGVLTTEETEELLEFMKEASGQDTEDPYAEEEPQYEEEGWEEDEPAGTAEEPARDVTEL